MATVMIVDDEPDIREVMRFALEAGGFRTLEAGHADEARKLLSEERELVDEADRHQPRFAWP